MCLTNFMLMASNFRSKRCRNQPEASEVDANSANSLNVSIKICMFILINCITFILSNGRVIDVRQFTNEAPFRMKIMTAKLCADPRKKDFRHSWHMRNIPRKMIKVNRLIPFDCRRQTVRKQMRSVAINSRSVIAQYNKLVCVFQCYENEENVHTTTVYNGCW